MKIEALESELKDTVEEKIRLGNVVKYYETNIDRISMMPSLNYLDS